MQLRSSPGAPFLAQFAKWDSTVPSLLGDFGSAWKSKAGRTRMPAPHDQLPYNGKSLPVSQRRLVRLFAGLERREALVDFVPVDRAPPCGQVFRTRVVVFQIVGVLPHVVAEDGIVALADGIILIRRRHDMHFAAGLAGEPDPSAAELLDSGIVEFGLEIFEVAESFLDRIGNGAARVASAFGLHDLPEHGVVDVATSVVADGAANVFGDGVQIADKILGGLA